jgi:hypothetical protein
MIFLVDICLLQSPFRHLLRGEAVVSGRRGAPPRRASYRRSGRSPGRDHSSGRESDQRDHGRQGAGAVRRLRRRVRSRRARLLVASQPAAATCQRLLAPAGAPRPPILRSPRARRGLCRTGVRVGILLLPRPHPELTRAGRRGDPSGARGRDDHGGDGPWQSVIEAAPSPRCTRPPSASRKRGCSRGGR